MPYIYVSSFDRVSGTDGDFVANLALQNLGRNQDFTRIRLTSATVTSTWWNVPSSASSLWFAEAGGGPALEAIVSPGNYTAATMMSALSTAMNAASSLGGEGRHYTCAYSSLTGQMSITCTEGTTLQVLSPRDGRFNALNQILGWSMSSNSSVGITVYSPRCVNMSKYENIYIYSSLVDASSSFTTSTGSCVPVLAAIPANTIPFNICYPYVPVQGGWRNLSVRPITGMPQARFQLLSEEGDIIDLHGGYITMVLEVE